MTVPATQHPAEVVKLDPEGLEVANCYLESGSIDATVDALDLPREVVTQHLNRREVKSYIDLVFRDLGFNNRFKIRKVLDVIIQKKLQELDEAGVGSSKDIADLLQMSHKMTMDLLDREIQLEKLRSGSSGTGIKSQVNVQINDSGSNYGNLLNKLMTGS